MEGIVYEGSKLVTRPNLNLFEQLQTDCSVTFSTFADYYPTSNLADQQSPIEFVINNSSAHFLDISKHRLYLKAKITASDGGNIAAANDVTFENNIFHSLFNSCEIFINGRSITESAGFYPYQSYIKTLLTKTAAEKESSLTSEGWYKDNTPDVPTTNDGYKTRQALSTTSKLVNLSGRLCSNIFEQIRYLPPNIQITLRLRRSTPEFCLHSPETGAAYKFAITSAKLQILKHVVHPQLELKLKEKLSNGSPMLYPGWKTEIRSYSIPRGNSTFTADAVFQGPLPSYVVVGFVESKALTGDYKKSPYNFQDFKLTSLELDVDGTSALYKNIDFDFAKGDFLEGYDTIFNSGVDHGISRDEYTKGNALTLFAILPRSGGRYTISKTGKVSIIAKFAENIENNISMIVYSQFQSLIELNKELNAQIQ